MPVAQYPYLATGAHPGFYNADYCPGPLQGAFPARGPAPPIGGPQHTGGPPPPAPHNRNPGSGSGSDRPLPGSNYENGLPGSHNGGPVPGPHNGGPMPGPHNGDPVPAPHNEGPVPGSHNKGPVPGPHNEGPVPGPHNGGPVPGPHNGGPVPGPHNGVPAPGFHNGVPAADTHTEGHMPGCYNRGSTLGTHNQGPMPGPHMECQVGGLHNVGPVTSLHSGCPVASCHNDAPGTSSHHGAPVHGYHSGGPSGGSHNGGSGPCERGVDAGRLVTGYHSGSLVSGTVISGSFHRGPHNSRQVGYPQGLGYLAPPPLLGHRAVPYINQRPHTNYLVPPYPYGTPPDPGHHPPPALQHCQPYPDCRPAAQYASYVHPAKDEHVSPQCPAPQHVSPQCPAPQHVSPQCPAPQNVSPQCPAPQHVSPQYPAPQHVSPQCPAPQHVSPQYPAPQHVSPQCPTPQHVSPQCPAPQHVSPQCPAPQHVSPQCPAPQHVSPQCPAPQHVSPQCPAPQHVSPQCPAPQHVSPQCPAPQHMPPQCPALNGDDSNLATKVEPDTDWWHDGALLDRLQQVRLHSEEPHLPPPPREYTKPRRRRRNSEKRKEKSRDAARCRRGKESEIFTELASALPLPQQTVAQLDKASVMRLTLAFLKTRALCQAGLSKTCAASGGSKLDVEMDGLILKALDGFLLVLSTDGDIVFTSENIVAFLGLPQVDVMGQSLYEYTHPCDHEEVRDLMSDKEQHEPRHTFLRLKCTLTAKGRSVNLKSASYKVVQVSGELVGGEQQAWLVALGTPVPHPSNIEFPLDKQTFVSKHSLDMKFTYVDDNVGEYCGYTTEELMGRSLYEMHHALDCDLVKDAYKTLRSKGQVETGRYRFLARAGGYVWLVTQATLIHGPKDHKPQYVVCLNYVVSGVERAGEILSELQLLCNSRSDTDNNNDDSTTSNNNSSSSSSSNVSNKSAAAAAPQVLRNTATPTVPLPKLETQPKVEERKSSTGLRANPAPPPVAATFKIFTPLTDDMTKGYLMFSDDDPHHTVLKEEPDDLTHLAPSVGDTCVPLLEVPSLIPDHTDTCMLQEVSTLIPELDDMFTLDYQMPITSSDVLITTSPDCSDNQEETPKYLYDESKLISGIKCINSLSGGKILKDKSGCCTISSDCGASSPEPPKPLLSQAALSPIRESKQSTVLCGGSHPRTTTGSLFTHLDEIRTSSSSDSFGKLDLKLEERNMDSDEFEMRAPYIPLSNEMLMLSPDDFLWGAEPEPLISLKDSASSSRDAKCCYSIIDKDDSNLAQLLRDTDPHITGNGPGRNLHIENSTGTQRSQYQQKFLDGGGNFVDPNKVLPGHSGSKDDLDGSTCSTLLVDPPPVMVQETVDPPPPLLTVDSHLVTLPVKRGHSPNSSPLLNHKKLCSPLCQRQHPTLQHHHQDGAVHHQLQPGGVRLLETPNAPTMQQLLISKEPITVRGGRPGGGISASQNFITNKSHSVLRNLLNVNGDGSIVIGEPQAGSSGLASATLHIPREKVTMLLAGNGGINADGQLMCSKLRLVTGNHSALMQAGHFAFKLATNPNGQSGQGLLKRGRRQDPLLLMDPETTIPNLLDLTQQDYEW